MSTTGEKKTKLYKLQKKKKKEHASDQQIMEEIKICIETNENESMTKPMGFS